MTPASTNLLWGCSFIYAPFRRLNCHCSAYWFHNRLSPIDLPLSSNGPQTIHLAPTAQTVTARSVAVWTWMASNLNWINEPCGGHPLHHNELCLFPASLLADCNAVFSSNSQLMAPKSVPDHLTTLTLSVSRGQTASIWRPLMQMDVRTKHWPVVVTDPSSTPSRPRRLLSRWQCQESRVPLPLRKCPAGLWPRAGVTHR